jgi:hypothetical protein
MIVTLKRDYESCRIVVIGSTLSIKDHNKSPKDTPFDSREEALAAADKFINRRLKTGRWQIYSKTLDAYYLQAAKRIEAIVAEERNQPGYDRIQCNFLPYHQASLTEIDSFTTALGICRDHFPASYESFLLTMDGLSIRSSVCKGNWCGATNLFFLSLRAQEQFTRPEFHIKCLQDINEPFIIVSDRNAVHDASSLTGAVLLPETGIIYVYEENARVNEFNDFRDYFDFELGEITQRFYDARAWVDRQAG